MKTNEKLPISVFIVTLNESAYLEKTLQSVQNCAEVVVVDSGSTDGTVEIAERHGAKVIHQPWLGYSKQKQVAMDHCSFDWVLNLDGDEEITTDALNELAAVMQAGVYDSVRLKRVDRFIGKFPGDSIKKANNLRFYRKSSASFDADKLVHESAAVKGKEHCSNNFFYHYGYDDISLLQQKLNTYSSLRAEEKFLKNKKHSALKIILVFPITFINKYIFGRLFLFGLRGFIKAVMEAHYAFLKEAKLYEKVKNKQK